MSIKGLVLAEKMLKAFLGVLIGYYKASSPERGERLG